MEDAEHEARLAQLTAEMAWLRRLARALLRTDEAQDLVQETWLVAAQHAPDDRPLRPWLSRVLGNVSRTHARGRQRREAREIASVTIEQPTPTPDELVQRVELHRLVSEEVLLLKEPYRNTVLLHYFEELPSAEIARRLNIPEGTVRRRLKVALDELRSRLDRKERNPGGLRALAPLAAMRATPTSSALAGAGSIVMKKVLIAIALLLLAGLATLSVHSLAQGSSSEQKREGMIRQLTLAGVPRPRAEAHGDPLAWFADRSAPARKIAGRVTFRGAPVKDAVVALHSVLSRAHAAAPIEMRTDANGGFDFGTRAPMPYFVTASSPNTTAAILDLPLADPTLKPPSEQLELRLGECSAVVEGKIYDASENPLPKIHVRRRGSFGDGLVGVESDERGQYRLCVPYGEVAVEYGGDAFGTVLLTIDARGEMHRDVVLVPEATLNVRVVRADNGDAVPDTYVIVGPLGSGPGPDRPAQMNGVTDKNGEVRISGLVPGRVGVFGRADGGLQSQTMTEALAQVGVETEVIVKLGGTARITGRVVDGTAPIPGAQVQAIRKSPGGGMGGGTGFSQPDGSFVLDHVPPGDVEFSARPFELDAPTSLRVEAGKSYDGVVLQVHPLATIRGRVTRLGKPAAGVDVCCVTSVLPSNVPTDADGHYEFRGVAPDTYAIQAASDGIGAFTLAKKITVKAGEDRTLNFELDVAGTIAGVVVDREGKPIQGVFVRWLHERTGDLGRCITDSQGRYRCGGMTGGGKYRAAVFPSADLTQAYPTADGGPYPELDVKDGATVIEGIKLAIDRPQLAISGRVLDNKGAPVADAVVKALSVPDGGTAQFNPWLHLPSTSADGDGLFTLRGITAGSYALQARAADGSEGVATGVVGGMDNAMIRIERAGSIEGKLVGFKQAPTIIARSLSDSRLIPGTGDGTTFRLAGLRPGRYVVSAQTVNEGETRIIEVRAGEITRTDMTSHGQAVIEGTVIDFRTRQPIPNVTCHAMTSVNGEPVFANWDLSDGAKSDASGHIKIDPAPAGTVTVTCRMVGFRSSPPSADVTVPRGGHAVVELMSVEATSENPSTIGIEFDWNATPPRISAVLPNSPAIKAGIAVGDVVTQVDGVAVQGLNGAGVQRLVESVPVGTYVQMTVLRTAETKTFTVHTLAGL